MHHLPAHPIARLVFVTLLVLSWTVGLSSAPVASANVTWSIDQLASAALASLKADYDVLITGQLPARPLVSRVDAFKQVRNPSQHFQNILARRSANASYGLTFTEVVVSLSDFDIVINGSELRLAATEKFALGFQSTQYAHDPARDRTLGTDRHTFVFSANPGGWMLVRDELAAFPLNQSGIRSRSPTGRRMSSHPRHARAVGLDSPHR